MIEELEKEIRDLEKKLEGKIEELRLLKNKDLLEKKSSMKGKCYKRHSQGITQYFLHVIDLRSDFAGYYIKTEQYVEYTSSLKGSCNFFSRSNDESSINKSIYPDLKEISEEEAKAEIKKLLSGLIRRYE